MVVGVQIIIQTRYILYIMIYELSMVMVFQIQKMLYLERILLIYLENLIEILNYKRIFCLNGLIIMILYLDLKIFKKISFKCQKELLVILLQCLKREMLCQLECKLSKLNYILKENNYLNLVKFLLSMLRVLLLLRMELLLFKMLQLYI